MKAPALTDKQKFLDWCKKHHARPRKMKGSDTVYILPCKTISIVFFGLTISPPEITVYFASTGKWVGGTNWLWDNRLPWIR